jgi:hypothetical protein
MTDSQSKNDLHPLADINQVIHAPARLMVLSYLYVVESTEFGNALIKVGRSWLCSDKKRVCW